MTQVRQVTFCLIVAILWFSPIRLHAQTPHLQVEQFKNWGVAYLEENRPFEAERAFARVIQLAPSEPLGYANLGIAKMRLGQLDAAASRLEQARRIAPDNIEVLLLDAEIQYAAGRWAFVIDMAEQALRVNPHHPMARYTIYRAAMAQRDDRSAQELAAQQLELLYRDNPQNTVIAVRYARREAEQKRWRAVAAALDRIVPLAREYDKAEELVRATRKALTETPDANVSNSLAALENVLRPTTQFRQDLAQLQPPVAGLPLVHFSDRFEAAVRRERPDGVPVQFQVVSDRSVPVGVGTALDITKASIDFADIDGNGRDEWLIAFAAGQQGGLQLLQSQPAGWRNVLGRSLSSRPFRQARLADLDDDGRFEVVAVGSQGTALLQQEDDGTWCDVLSTWRLESEPANSIEVIDADNDGDLDLCVAGVSGFKLWQNRPHRAFLDLTGRTGLAAASGNVQRLVTTDYDDDLDTDLFIVDAQERLQLWGNERYGTFARTKCGLSTEGCRDSVARDVDNNGFEDLICIKSSGQLAIQYNHGGSFAPAAGLPLEHAEVSAVVDLDFDNDGWVDLAVAGERLDEPIVAVLRNLGDGNWATTVLPSPVASCISLGAVDYDRDGDLDLVALERRGQIRTWRNDGGNANHWLRVQLSGLQIAGSKNNLHGVGSKLEIKTGLFYEMQFVRRPVTHFGLGPRTQADLLRVVWSNGVPQNRFRPTADQTVREVQVLKGSCPYLYCWDGNKFVFVTDTLAGAPLGLQVAEGVIAPDNPRELLTVDRDKIASHNGQYVFQYTSELWETVYLDQVSLWAVDHPMDSAVYTDQRFLPPPYSTPQPTLTRQRVWPKRVEDTQGREVTAALLEFDHQYPERLHATRYQGLVQPHCMTLYFGDVKQLVDPVLVVRCWIFWTDTSINVAASQDPTHPATPTVMEVWDRQLGWQPVDEPFGLPSGKDKWILLNVARYLDTEDARVRIRSQAEIHWDQALLADRGQVVPRRITKLLPTDADLHFGGFNELYRPTNDGPHLYRYGQQTDSPIWMNMTGRVTHYGDVHQLLTAADDCFAIFTGGDEVTIRFDAAALPDVPPGWQRDFLFYSDGWEKDSDRNTIRGETVDPLPFHGMSAYPYPAGESYPEDPLHQDYRQRYNTRHIGPHAFRSFVKNFSGSSPPLLPWDNEPGVRGDHTK